jgi:ribosomal protein S18 acetylase RimI-like enzyme
VSEFAEYAPGVERGQRRLLGGALAIRPPRHVDLAAAAAIAAAREGESVAGWVERFARLWAECQGGLALFLVAARDDVVIGYAKVNRFVSPAAASANVVPAGWYLTGVVVEPGSRRCGVGSALTRARLAWIAERSDRAYYVANERNRASIDLHAALGFRELSRDFHHPGVEFEGGSGILFVCRLEAGRPW